MIFSKLRTALGMSSSENGRQSTPAGPAYFEIVEIYHGQRRKPLGDHVTFDVKEAERLRIARVDAYAASHPTGRRPQDVFHEFPYRPVNPEHVIRTAQLKPTAPKKLPEFSAIMQVRVVSDRVRNAIEALEPGRHAFFPVDIVSADGKQAHRYHFMQFLERLDCIDPARSGYIKGTRQDGSQYWTPPAVVAGRAKVHLKRGCIGGRHLFWETNTSFNSYISAELAASLGDFLQPGLELRETVVID